VQRRPRHELEGRDGVVFDSGAVIGGGRSHSEKQGGDQNVGWLAEGLGMAGSVQAKRGEDVGSRG
jgi:hypothetical protein